MTQFDLASAEIQPPRPDPANGLEPSVSRRILRRAGALMASGAMALGVVAAREEVTGETVRADTTAALAQNKIPTSSTELSDYITGIARAWEPYVQANGHVTDPLDPADGGDNYGVIMMADTPCCRSGCS